MGYITQLTCDVRHVKETDNIIAGTLFCIVMVSVVPDARIDYQAMAEAQERELKTNDTEFWNELEKLTRICLSNE
ncbi:unnamed protein product [Protopolystoma xenopodis]|uniref:Uncharacterized protein n=1 Tax=Protopolystoma xenopodis TaxID=117903 RepID=A0A448WEJ1_9PLAT|nr:unnamed protein product [Protopolystoma xenopodis]